jgi:hypothetical protein
LDENSDYRILEEPWCSTFFGCRFKEVFVKRASEMSENDEKRRDAAEAL